MRDMMIRIEYKNTAEIKVKTISIIGDFNKNDLEKGKMQEKDGTLYINQELPKGRHKYKFIINEHIKINDYYANLYEYNIEKNELWSVLLVNENGERLYNISENGLTIQGYNITNRIQRNDEINQKVYNRTIDKKIVVKLDIEKITGIHEVSAIWYVPNGEVYAISHNTVIETLEIDGYTIWFYLELDKMENIEEGIWKVRICVDGKYIFEDAFKVYENVSLSIV